MLLVEIILGTLAGGIAGYFLRLSTPTPTPKEKRCRAANASYIVPGSQTVTGDQPNIKVTGGYQLPHTSDGRCGGIADPRCQGELCILHCRHVTGCNGKCME